MLYSSVEKSYRCSSPSSGKTHSTTRPTPRRSKMRSKTCSSIAPNIVRLPIVALVSMMVNERVANTKTKRTYFQLSALLSLIWCDRFQWPSNYSSEHYWEQRGTTSEIRKEVLGVGRLHRISVVTDLAYSFWKMSESLKSWSWLG